MDMPSSAQFIKLAEDLAEDIAGTTHASPSRVQVTSIREADNGTVQVGLTIEPGMPPATAVASALQAKVDNSATATTTSVVELKVLHKTKQQVLRKQLRRVVKSETRADGDPELG